MQIAVWDTYVKRADGKIMHFDILAPSHIIEQQTIFDFGKDYLSKKPFMTSKLSTKECQFCHIEQATEKMITEIKKKGYSIIEMENCN